MKAALLISGCLGLVLIYIGNSLKTKDFKNTNKSKKLNIITKASVISGWLSLALFFILVVVENWMSF